MELSIVIVSYNVSHFLKQALDSLIIATRGINAEIIVVDNNSSDDSVAMVRILFPCVRLIVSYDNEGYAAACNKGIKCAAGQYILILNPDTIVMPDALQKAIDFMVSHPETGAIGARMTDGTGRFLPESKRAFPSPLTSLFRMTGIGSLFPRSALFNRYYLGHLPDNKPCRADILTGAFMFTRRSVLNETGLFDTAFFMYGEDIDLSWRMILKGYVNYYLPEVAITHFKGRSAPQTDPKRIRNFHMAMIIFARKYLPGYWMWAITGAVCLKMYLALLTASFRRHCRKTC